LVIFKKIIFSTVLLVAGFWGSCLAQAPREAVQQDPLRAGGTFYVYDNGSLPKLTPPPAGYKPFYISHFSRHGARWSTSEYDSVHVWFSKAAQAEVLTDAGKDFFARYEPFYQKARLHKGTLTGVGKAQHRSIAANIYKRFPQVFCGQTHVEAASTESPRVIMSMWSFISSLQSLDRSIDIDADASAEFAPWLQPSLSLNPYYRRGTFRIGKKAGDALDEYFLAAVPWTDIVSRFFSGPEVLPDVLKTTPEFFIRYLHGVVYSGPCLDEDRDIFDGVFTEEESYRIWKVLSARHFTEMARYEGTESLAVGYAGFTLEQIIESADSDINSGSTKLRLRFGHDSGIMPLLVLLDVNGFGRSTSSIEEAVSIFPDYNVPMGCNIQFVFYRKPGKDILVKVLLNEMEASLPLTPVKDTYYRWEDFKEHYLPVIRESKATITK
jgi:hypothetical protein